MAGGSFSVAAHRGAAWVVALVLLACAEVRAQDAPAKDGMFVTVDNPITDGTVSKIRSQIEEAFNKQRRAISVVVFDFNPKGPSGTSAFGSCNDLADLIRKFRLGQVDPKYPRLHTIAFVSDRVSKHTVLPVLACGEIVMSGQPDPATRKFRAQLGDVVEEQGTLTATMRAAYEDAARAFGSEDLIAKMIDRHLVVRKVKTRDGIRYWSDATIQKRRAAGEQFVEDPAVPSGLEAGNTRFDPEQARAYGLSKATYDTRVDLAAALKLPRRALVEDPLAGRTVVPWRIEVRGPLDAGKIESLQRRIKSAVARGANFIMLQLDCEAGDASNIPAAARELLTVTGENRLPVKTVAYIPPRRSLGAATFLALGCGEIVMASDAALGDFGYLKDRDPKVLQDLRDNLVELAKVQGYPPLLFEATLDRDLVLYRVRAQGDTSDFRLITAKQLDEDKASKTPRWQAMGRIPVPSGQFLKVDATLAKEWHVASQTEVDSPEALYALYNLDSSKVRFARDDWLDKIAEFFREPLVNVVLIMLGIIGLILELKMPGVGLPGVMAAVCFVLFFWAYSFVGEFTMLAVLLFVLGLILIAVEVFVLPGFGVTGISGITLVVVSLVLVTLEKMPETSQDWMSLGTTLSTFGISLVGAIAVAIMIAWYLPHIPYANRLVLHPPAELPAEEELVASGLAAPASLLGSIGIAATALRPSGRATFGDDYLDVVAEGDYVTAGTRVQIIEIEGNRIVVKAL